MGESAQIMMAPMTLRNLEKGHVRGGKVDVIILSVPNSDDQKQFSLEIELVFSFL